MIQETQQREWAADGSLRVKSNPILDIVGGSKFTTSAEFIVEHSAAQQGCEVSPLLKSYDVASQFETWTNITNVSAIEMHRALVLQDLVA